ncbi:hypothetical protein OSTOST_15796 [Ostertagia ostertagi]
MLIQPSDTHLSGPVKHASRMSEGLMSHRRLVVQPDVHERKNALAVKAARPTATTTCSTTSTTSARGDQLDGIECRLEGAELWEKFFELRHGNDYHKKRPLPCETAEAVAICDDETLADDSPDLMVVPREGSGDFAQLWPSVDKEISQSHQYRTQPAWVAIALLAISSSPPPPPMLPYHRQPGATAIMSVRGGKRVF